MIPESLFDLLLPIWIGVAVLSGLPLFRLPAPYGRHLRSGWGPTTSARLAWFWMELPALAVPVLLFAFSDRTGDLPSQVFLLLWCTHYGHRVLVYPLRLPANGKRTPIFLPLCALVFNGVNGLFQGNHLFFHAEPYGVGWFADPRFLLGVALFFGGMAINLRADAQLLRLRRREGAGYAIPRGGPFRWISSPNYLGEILEWLGWAVLTWSLAGLSFAIWTAANLVPRARSNHRWYRETFPDYPPERRALIPGIW